MRQLGQSQVGRRRQTAGLMAGAARKLPWSTGVRFSQAHAPIANTHQLPNRLPNELTHQLPKSGPEPEVDSC